MDNIFENNSFDVIVTNPPYKKSGTGIKNLNQKKEGLKYLKQAININPSNQRLKDNLKFFI